MQDEKNTPQQLGRTDDETANFGDLSKVRVGDEVDISRLESIIAAASPLPWICEGGRITSEPLAREWEEVEAEFPPGMASMPADDPRWDTLPDPTVAFVTPSVDGLGQGDRDAMLIIEACTALPRLLRRVQRLERERDEAGKHLRTVRKEFAATRDAMGYLMKRPGSSGSKL